MPWEKKKNKEKPKSVLLEEAVETVGALQMFKVVERDTPEK